MDLGSSRYAQPDANSDFHRNANCNRHSDAYAYTNADAMHWEMCTYAAAPSDPAAPPHTVRQDAGLNIP
jgi:hypothetical protein